MNTNTNTNTNAGKVDPIAVLRRACAHFDGNGGFCGEAMPAALAAFTALVAACRKRDAAHKACDPFVGIDANLVPGLYAMRDARKTADDEYLSALANFPESK